MIVVADSSPLIALARIERLDLLRDLFGSVLLPTAVWREVVQEGVDRPGAAALMATHWIEERAILDVGLAAHLRKKLGAGESEAIVLAKEVVADFLLMDERLGPKGSKRLGPPRHRIGGNSNRGSGARSASGCCRGG